MVSKLSCGLCFSHGGRGGAVWWENFRGDLEISYDIPPPVNGVPLVCALFFNCVDYLKPLLLYYSSPHLYIDPGFWKPLTPLKLPDDVRSKGIRKEAAFNPEAGSPSCPKERCTLAVLGPSHHTALDSSNNPL